jgi:hypothetical protein
MGLLSLDDGAASLFVASVLVSPFVSLAAEVWDSSPAAPLFVSPDRDPESLRP